MSWWGHKDCVYTVVYCTYCISIGAFIFSISFQFLWYGVVLNTTGSCKMMLPCLQCKLPCVFTTNKSQLGWRTKHITFSLGLWATKTTPILRPPSMELGGYPLQTPGCHALCLISNGFYQKAKRYWLPTYIMTSHTHAGVKRWQLSADKCMGNQNTS